MPEPAQSSTSFDEISRLIWKYREERDWLGNSAKSYAISMVLEAAELLEHYQWQEESVGGKQTLAEELADIFIYGFEFAQNLDIDIAEAMKQKLRKTSLKYPAEKFKGKTKAERTTAWIQAKLGHQKDGL